MSTLTTVSTRVVVSTQNRLAVRGEHGQTTSEYGVAVLVAIALGMAVLEIFTHGELNPVLSALLKKALTTATGMVH